MSSYAITGASRGLGREYVNQFSQDPLNTVFALVRNPSAAGQLKELAEKRTKVHIIKADVTDPESLIEAAAQVSKISGGKLDVLIHNAVQYNEAAAFLTPSQIPLDKEATHDMFDYALSSSLYGTIWTTNAFLPLIEKGADKKIILTSTGLVDMNLTKVAGVAMQVDYVVGKAALNVLAAKYAVELAPKGIKVLAMSPGWVDTYEGPQPRPAQLQDIIDATRSAFRKYDPAFAAGPITPQDSVRMQREVIARLDMELSGTFVGQHGDQNWA